MKKFDKIVPASDEKISKLEKELNEFCDKILQVEPLITTDKTTLKDYEKDLDEIKEQVELIYSVNISHIIESPLYEILEIIYENKTNDIQKNHNIKNGNVKRIKGMK